MLNDQKDANPSGVEHNTERTGRRMDAYRSAEVETDGAIPRPFSIPSFAIGYAGSFDSNRFERPRNHVRTFYKELQPLSEKCEPEGLKVNGLFFRLDMLDFVR